MKESRIYTKLVTIPKRAICKLLTPGIAPIRGITVTAQWVYVSGRSCDNPAVAGFNLVGKHFSFCVFFFNNTIPALEG